MSLQCNVTLNTGSYTAGQTPPPNATVQVYNPNAVAVAVTGIRVYFFQLGATQQALASSPSVPPTGPGQNLTPAALSSINIGPFPVVVGSAANANAGQSVAPANSIFPINPQPSQPMQYVLMVGAEVYGSDGSVNVATPAPLLVSFSINPPPASAGGYLQFAVPSNSAGVIPGWP